MKTLPYLKQLTYAVIIMAFPFIFSASKDSRAPKPIEVKQETAHPAVYNPDATLKTIRTTVDSLKRTGAALAQMN